MKNTLLNFKNTLKLHIPDPNFVETKTAFKKKKLSERQSDRGEKGRWGKEEDLAFPGSLPKWPQWLGLRQATARNSLQVSDMVAGAQELEPLAVPFRDASPGHRAGAAETQTSIQ